MVYDAIVLGVGSMGSSACYQLASRGLKVLGLEQLDIVHEEGSHTGQSRLIRKAYFEDPSYIPLLGQAYNGWKEIEEKTQTQHYWQTGISYFGSPDDPIIEGVKKASEAFGIPLETHSSEEYPMFQLPEKFECIFEAEAGFLSPEKGITSLAILAQENGAEILTNQKVIRWEDIGNHIVVTTQGEEFHARKLIICAGAFVSDLFTLPFPLTPTKQYLAWSNIDQSQLGEMPCWVISEKGQEGIYYGFPSDHGLPGPQGMKYGYHRPGISTTIGDEEGWEMEKLILEQIQEKYFTEPKEIHTFKCCKYTYSHDENFVIDWLPNHQNKVMIATGFSGHGFKFVPVIGEIIADLIQTGSTNHNIDLFKLDRF